MTIILISTFFICLVLGVPLAFCLLLASISFILTSADNIPLEVVSQRLMVGIDDFTFMAIPLFVFAKWLKLFLMPSLRCLCQLLYWAGFFVEFLQPPNLR